MDGEQKFWVSCWGIVGATILGIATLFYASFKHEDDMKAQMVKDGYSPLEVMCAFPKTSNENILCITKVMKGDE